jgi:hypothetical protein
LQHKNEYIFALQKVFFMVYKKKKPSGKPQRKDAQSARLFPSQAIRHQGV